MADQATVRVSGAVLACETIRGVSKRTDEAYEMTNVRVLVGNAGIAEVTLGRDMTAPAVGDFVDWTVEVQLYGGRMRLSARSDFPALLGA